MSQLSKTEIIDNTFLVLDQARRKNNTNMVWNREKDIKEKIEGFYDRKEPLKLLFPSFPFKANNMEKKVISRMPDDAERLALMYYDYFVYSLEQVFPYGARLDIMEDGQLFSDFMGVDDKEGEAYGRQMRNMVINPNRVGFIAVKDYFPGIESYADIRQAFFGKYCRSAEETEALLPTDSYVKSRYDKSLPFMTEEFSNRTPGNSEQEKQMFCHKMALEVVRRDIGLGDMIDSLFGSYLRCTRHLQDSDSIKLSLTFWPGRNEDPATWHSALLKLKDGSFRTMTKLEAESEGYSLIKSFEGTPLYYLEKSSHTGRNK